MNSPENATPDLPQLVSDSSVAAGKNPVAPLWHTIVLVGIVFASSFLGASREHRVTGPHGRTILYTAIIIWEWLLVGYVVLGIRRRAVRIRDLIRGRWSTAGEFFTDIGIAVAFWFLAMIVLGSLGYVLGLGNANAAAEAKAKIGFMIPANRLELLLFLAVSMTAGFCEEVIFRGYLQRQFLAVTRNEIAAVLLQGMVFGAAHGYEGGARMLLIAVYGTMFGLLAMWRKSLRPGMIAHGMHDGIEGIALYASRFLHNVK